MGRAYVFVVVVATCAAVVGCRKPAKLVLTKDQRARIEENILAQAPTPKIPIHANFGDNIRLIGLDLSQDRIRPGETMTATYYWECLRETPGEWKIFVHLELPGGKRMILDHHPVGELYPIANWKKGEIVRDIQRFTVAADTTPGPATLWVGLFNEAIYREQGGGDRMEIRNKDQVPHDGDNRVRAARFTVVAAGDNARNEAPILVARRTGGKVQVDGRLDDEAWTRGERSPPFGNADGSEAEEDLATTVTAVYDDEHLYIAFAIRDPAIESPYQNRDEELWNADAVEVFLDPGADGKDYIEIQVSPANVIFDARFETHRNPDWTKARTFNLSGIRTGVSVTGSLNQSRDKDSGWDVEIAIPFAEIPGFGQGPPNANTVLRANFFRIEARDGKVIGAQAFSPAAGDFHDLSKAGRIRFETGASAMEGASSTPGASAMGDPTVTIPMRKVQRGEIPPAVRAGPAARFGTLRTTSIPPSTTQAQ